MAAALKKKFNLKKGDLVAVIAGRDKGKQGKVTEIVAKDDRIVVEGVNLVSRHTKPSQKNPQGGMIQKSLPLHISNVMLVDPKTGKPTRTGKKEVNGKWVRTSKSTGEVLE
jgi:large subunit ribosomal protein L24